MHQVTQSTDKAAQGRFQERQEVATELHSYQHWYPSVTREFKNQTDPLLGRKNSQLLLLHRAAKLVSDMQFLQTNKSGQSEEIFHHHAHTCRLWRTEVQCTPTAMEGWAQR